MRPSLSRIVNRGRQGGRLDCRGGHFDGGRMSSRMVIMIVRIRIRIGMNLAARVGSASHSVIIAVIVECFG